METNSSIQQQTRYLLNTGLAVLPLYQLPHSKSTESVRDKDHSNVWTGPYRSILCSPIKHLHITFRLHNNQSHQDENDGDMSVSFSLHPALFTDIRIQKISLTFYLLST